MIENNMGNSFPDYNITNSLPEDASRLNQHEEKEEESPESGEYSLEDDDNEEGNYYPDKYPDTEGENPDEYLEDENEDENEEENQNGKRKSAFSLLFGMMMTPVEGWKRIRRSRISVDEMARTSFYPLVAIASISCFSEFFYNTATTLSMAMVEAVKIFVTFFFGNFLALMLIKMLMPKEYKDIADSKFGREYIMYLLSTLAIFTTLYEIFPMLGPVISFLPLWTVYLMIRGSRFFRFPAERHNTLVTILCLIIIGCPIIIYWIFNMLL